jgi:hypothetical protein
VRARAPTTPSPPRRRLLTDSTAGAAQKVIPSSIAEVTRMQG